MHLEAQVGNIPKKLKEHEQDLRLLIRESGNNMEQVTSSLCAATMSLRKKKNEEIISLGGPSKRTRFRMQKMRAEAIGVSGFSTVDTIKNTTDVGKEIVKLIKEL